MTSTRIGTTMYIVLSMSIMLTMFTVSTVLFMLVRNKTEKKRKTDQK